MVPESGEEPLPTLVPVNKLSPDPAVRCRGHHQDPAGLPAPLASLDKQPAASRPSRLSLSSPTGTSASSPSRLHHSHGGVPAHHSRLHSSSPVPRRMAHSPLPGSGCDGSAADSGPKPDSPVSTRSSGLPQNGFHSPTLAPTRARVQAGAGAAQGQQPLAGGRASLDAPFLPQWSSAGRSRRASQVFGLHLSVGGASLDHTSAMSGDSFGSAKSSRSGGGSPKQVLVCRGSWDRTPRFSKNSLPGGSPSRHSLDSHSHSRAASPHAPAPAAAAAAAAAPAAAAAGTREMARSHGGVAPQKPTQHSGQVGTSPSHLPCGPSHSHPPHAQTPGSPRPHHAGSPTPHHGPPSSPPPLAVVAGQDIVLRPPVLLPHFIVYAEQQQQQQQPQQHVEQQGQQHQWQERHRSCGSMELGTSGACSRGAALASALQHSTLHLAEVAMVAIEAAPEGRPGGMGSVLAAAVGPATEPGAAVDVPNLPGLATEPEPVVEPRPTLEPEAAAGSQPPEVPGTTAKSEEAVAVAVQPTVAPEHVAEAGAAAEPDLEPAHGAIAGSAPPTSAPLLRHPPLPRARPPITHRHSTIGFTQRHVSAHTGVGLAVAQVAFLLNSRPQTVQPPLTQQLSQPLPDGPNPREHSLLAASPLLPGPRALCHSASGLTAAYSTLQPSSSQLSSRGPIPCIGQLSGPATRPRPSPTAPSPVKGLPPLPSAPRAAKVPLSVPLSHVSSPGLALPSPQLSPSTQQDTLCHPPRPGATAPPRTPSVSGTTAESLGLLSLRWSVSGSKAIDYQSLPWRPALGRQNSKGVGGAGANGAPCGATHALAAGLRSSVRDGEAPLEGEPQVGFAALGFSHSISLKSEEQWEEWSRGWVSSSGTAAQEQHSGLREVQEEQQEQVAQQHGRQGRSRLGAMQLAGVGGMHSSPWYVMSLLSLLPLLGH
ncbi:hypothetical protein QJQ45_005171 [Haematococcus lacustris]|nr:hypothetical protein QJQ45_005171 [Haematococcus lacustris]